MRPRTLALAAAVAALVGVAGYTAYWFVAAGWLRDGVAAWVEARRAEGYTVEHEGLEVSGFPFRLRAEIDAPSIENPRSWTWTAERLRFAARPWSFDRIWVTLPAEQRLISRRDAGAESVVTAAVERGVVLLEFASGRLDRLAVEAAGLALATPEGETLLVRLDARGRRAADATIPFTVEIESLTLPPRVDVLLGREIARLAADGTVVGGLSAGPIADALAAWSAAGGRVDLEQLVLRWSDLSVDARGTLALDAKMRPLAALTADIEGYAEVLDALAAAGALKAREAGLAKVALGLLAKPGPNGRLVLTVPVTAQNGTLYVGPLALFKLAPVVPR